LFTHYWPLDVEGLGRFEAYPNRDSIPYRDIYGIADAGTMYRGTLRNLGWCDNLYKIAALGFLDDQPRDVAGKTYAQFTHNLLPAGATQTGNPSTGSGRSVKTDLAAYLKVDPDSPIIANLEWLGLLDEQPLQVAGNKISPLDLLTNAYSTVCSTPKASDMVVLVHHLARVILTVRRKRFPRP
jgi:saccharopine dehydrogenase-like NADP-dependent oxidoreductase